jgi:hypothetical protein
MIPVNSRISMMLNRETVRDNMMRIVFFIHVNMLVKDQMDNSICMRFIFHSNYMSGFVFEPTMIYIGGLQLQT